MCTINLQEIMTNKSYPEAGKILYDRINEKINDENKIIINLDGVISLPSMFLNVSIGKFIETYGVALLKQKISFAQISSTQAERIKEYIENLENKKITQ